MIKLFLTLFLLSTSVAFAQTNTFPASGSVGIGTNSPQKILHVSGTGDVEQWIEATDNGYASLTLKTNNQKWHWSKRPSWEGDALKLFYHDGNQWIMPSYMSVATNGRIGLGEESPQARLHVKGGILGSNPMDRIDLLSLQSGGGTGGNNIFLSMYNYRNDAGNDWLTSSTRIQAVTDGTSTGYIEFNPKGNWYGLAFGTGGYGAQPIERMRISSNGNVGIGTTSLADINYKLFVETGIRTRKVKVDALTWADHVFQPSYQLIPLKDVEAFIAKNMHLPGVPSAIEVSKEGIDLGNTQAVLLQKIEELTLYVIDQNKEIEKLKEQNKMLLEIQKEVAVIKRQLSR